MFVYFFFFGVFLFQQYFQKEVPARFDPCPDVLFTAAYGVKYSAKRMKKWEKDYVALKTKEQEDQEEVRVRNTIFTNNFSQQKNRHHPYYVEFYSD